MVSALSEFLDDEGESARGDAEVSSSIDEVVESHDVGREDAAEGGGDRR